ncbi:hypothetical protein [Enterococcus sp.]|uniref:hypothetical protein n=1 Tax=Enterococcus sp. TaxID=35783 RepID=UPI002FCAFB14
MKEVEVIGVLYLPKSKEYYINLANEHKLRVNREECTKMKRRLSGKSKVFIDVEVSE